MNKEIILIYLFFAYLINFIFCTYLIYKISEAKENEKEAIPKIIALGTYLFLSPLFMWILIGICIKNFIKEKLFQ